jgi:nitrogen fixation/metabolism regulation signal transduction histidine kinase
MSKRSKILVDPPVQWAIAGRIVGHWMMLFSCLITINVMVGVLTSVGQTSFGRALTNAAMAEMRTLAVLLLLMPIFLRDTLKLSNRFAGPMYRLRTALKTMSGGEVPKPIKFRTGDFWLEAADDFNAVRSNYESLQSENDALKAEIESLRRDEVTA